MKRPSFLSLPRPIVTCILRESTVQAAVATIKNGEFEGAHAFAIHLEGLNNADLTKENFTRIAQCTRKPVMFLRYRHDGSLTDEERVRVLLDAAESGAAAVDFTADTFDPSPHELTHKPDIIARQMKLIDKVHQIGAEVIMSSHITSEALNCDQILEHMKAVEQRGPDFAKIVTAANTEEEFIEALRTTLALRREMKIPFIFLCGGKFALPQRYFGPALGNALTFSVQRYTDQFVTSQPPLANMLSVLNGYNWHIDETAE